MKEKYLELTNKIIKALELELPEQYSDILAQFKHLIGEDKFRASYAELDKLMHLSDFSPSSDLKGFIIKYQIVF